MAEEASIEAALVKAVKEAGGLCIKLPAILYRGIPDRMILLPGGRLFFVELKARKGRASVAQNNFRDLLFTLGFRWCMIKGMEELHNFVLVYLKKDP